jgi:hypothetical protein
MGVSLATVDRMVAEGMPSVTWGRRIRRFAGWYMGNELEMSSEDVAIALGHQDGGNLVRRLYGHRDKGRALDRIVGAYADAASDRATGIEARDQWWDKSLDPARLFDPGEPLHRLPHEDIAERLR